jgi:hypothetical protein
METKQETHNLNINMYSLEELLALFDLTYTISYNQLKQAKRKVLMLHPDKSKLPPEYFLFYKKAFEVVVQFYETNNKQNQAMTEEATTYRPLTNELNKSTIKKVTTIAGEMAPQEFQAKFNQLFEDNMVSKPDMSKHDWFKQENPVFQTSETVSTKNMGQVFDTFKQKTNDMIAYRGVQEIQVSNGTRLYDEDEEDGTYVTSDPFSKLKFDDLRKVHKDQTIFSVSEKDFSKVKQYASVDQYSRERGGQSLEPLEKTHAEQLLAEKDRVFREQIMKKQHEANLRTMQYEEKNKSVMSSFLQLRNG